MTEPIEYASKDTIIPPNKRASQALGMGIATLALTLMAITFERFQSGPPPLHCALFVTAAAGFIVGIIGLIRPGRKKSAIIGIVLCLGVPFLTVLVPLESRVTKARIASTRAEITALKNHLSNFQLDNGRFPTTAEGLAALVTSPPGLSTWNGPYIQAVPEDKWGHPYHYQFPNPTNPITFELFSAGDDGVPGNSDDIKSP